MIRYSNTPDKNAKTITNSPTSPIITTKDKQGLLDINDQSQDKPNILDLDSQDQDGTD
jgi:hypothetical protein